MRTLICFDFGAKYFAKYVIGQKRRESLHLQSVLLDKSDENICPIRYTFMLKFWKIILLSSN